MLTLQNQSCTCRLNDDLSSLEFCMGAISFLAENPFVFRWTDREVDLGKLAHHQTSVTGDRIEITFSGLRFEARFPGNHYCRPEQAPDFRFSITLQLEEEELVIRTSTISPLPEGEIRLIIAGNFFRFRSDETAQLILPAAYGIRFDFPRQDELRRTFQPISGLTLPMYARFTRTGGIGLWCDEPDRTLELAVNAETAGECRAVTELLFDDFASAERELRFRLFPPGSDFRDLARVIRARLKAEKRFRSFAEKQHENPELQHLPGTVFWKHSVYFKPRPDGVDRSYSLYTARPDWNENEGMPGNWTADELFSTAREQGFDRVFACNTGWNFAGFDAGYPTRLPVNPERGTAEEFKRCAQAAKASSPGYLLSCHDNYIDAYPGPEYHPEEMYQPIPGVPLRGSIWRGGLAHWLCPACALRYARRDLPRIAELSGRGGIYLDVMAAVPPMQCRSGQHPLTRREDLLRRRELFQLAIAQFGALAVEGCGSSAFADLIAIGAYGWLHWLDVSPLTAPLPVPVPLWQMVYHDSVLNFFGEGYAFVHGSEYRLWQALLTLLPANFDEHGKRLSRELRSAFTSTMVDYRELETLSVHRDSARAFRTAGVAESCFADGTRVIANFNDTPYRYEGKPVPAREYRIVQKNGSAS